MYYHVISARLTPGKRFPAVEHMKRLKAFVEDKYGVDAQVLGNENGHLYVHHFVTSYDSMGHYQEVMLQLFDDEEYKGWFAESMEKGLVDWANAESNFYRVF